MTVDPYTDSQRDKDRKATVRILMFGGLAIFFSFLALLASLMFG